MQRLAATLIVSAVLALPGPLLGQVELSAGSPLIKAEVKVGTDVKEREPVGVAEYFGPGTTSVVGWTRVTGASQPTVVVHVWRRNGNEVGRSELKVKSESYRTYSKKDISGQPGQWALEVLDGAGNILASTDFTVSD